MSKSKRDRQLIEQHAAPEALAKMLEKALARAREADREVEWLTKALVRRMTEKNKGIWPEQHLALDGTPCEEHSWEYDLDSHEDGPHYEINTVTGQRRIAREVPQ